MALSRWLELSPGLWRRFGKIHVAEYTMCPVVGSALFVVSRQVRAQVKTLMKKFRSKVRQRVIKRSGYRPKSLPN